MFDSVEFCLYSPDIIPTNVDYDTILEYPFKLKGRCTKINKSSRDSAESFRVVGYRAVLYADLFYKDKIDIDDIIKIEEELFTVVTLAVVRKNITSLSHIIIGIETLNPTQIEDDYVIA